MPGYDVRIIDSTISPDYRRKVLQEVKDALCLGISVVTGPMIRETVEVAKAENGILPVILRRLASFSAAQADPRRDYLTPECFDNLGKLLLLMSLLWFYFIFAERLTTWYGNARSEIAVLWLTQRGPYRQLFWAMLCCNFVIPFPLLAIKKLRTIAGTLLHQSQ